MDRGLAVTQLAALGQMPDESASIQTVEEYERLIRQLEAPATLEEARLLLDVLPVDDNTFFGAAWSLVHFIESATGWPDPAVLDERGWWATFLRERAARGGRLPRA